MQLLIGIQQTGNDHSEDLYHYGKMKSSSDPVSMKKGEIKNEMGGILRLAMLKASKA